jgi:transketolase
MYLGELSGLKLGPATRDAFGETFRELGKTNPRLVTVDGDVGNSTRTEPFALAFPERAFNVGIAESNMVTSLELAACGKISSPLRLFPARQRVRPDSHVDRLSPR